MGKGSDRRLPRHTEGNTPPAQGRGGLWPHEHTATLEAGWHKQGLEVICSADARPWENYYAYYVRRHMPALGVGRAALASNLRFTPIRKLKAGQITGAAKQVFEAL